MSAALGFRVKSGWAAAVLLTGPKTAPRVVDSRIVELSDAKVPHSRQPYHAGMGTAQTNRHIVDRLVRGIERFSRRSLAALVAEHRADHQLRAAGVVVSSLIDPATIASPHMRAHASEGRLFRAITASVAAAVVLERDVYDRLARKLRRAPATVKAQVAALGDGVGRWRAEQKVAAAAAWLVLSGG